MLESAFCAMFLMGSPVSPVLSIQCNYTYAPSQWCDVWRPCSCVLENYKKSLSRNAYKKPWMRLSLLCLDLLLPSACCKSDSALYCVLLYGNGQTLLPGPNPLCPKIIKQQSCSQGLLIHIYCWKPSVPQVRVWNHSSRINPSLWPHAALILQPSFSINANHWSSHPSSMLNLNL